MKGVKFVINVYDSGKTANWLLIFLLKLSKMYWVDKLAQAEQWSVRKPEANNYFCPAKDKAPQSTLYTEKIFGSHD